MSLVSFHPIPLIAVLLQILIFNLLLQVSQVEQNYIAKVKLVLYFFLFNYFKISHLIHIVYSYQIVDILQLFLNDDLKVIIITYLLGTQDDVKRVRMFSLHDL